MITAKQARLIVDTAKLRKEIDAKILKAAEAEQTAIVLQEKCENTQFVVDELIKKGFKVRKERNYWLDTTFLISW